MEPCWLVVVVLLSFSSSSAEWCYTEPSCDPSTWASLGSCNGSRQSPIDIPEDSAKFNESLGPIVFKNYSNQQTLQSISNTGHTVEIAVSTGVSVSGGGLPSTYEAIAFHFHWGNGTSGSEHRLSGKQFPMEMHIVHTKGGMNLSQAKQDPSGIAVLAFFIDVADPTNRSQLGVLSDQLDGLSAGKLLNVSVSLADLLGDVNLKMYYRYMGSLTTPTCDQVVLWTVFKTPITVPSKVVSAFSSAVKTNVTGNLETLQNNFRPPQSLNGRSVQASFSRSAALSPNSTAASSMTGSSSATLGSSAMLSSSATLSTLMLLQLFLTRW
ncbi:carbonic anhydrase 4-like [Hyla sarda]|uniref:carbonic anhydrase 4-like n=1 Tax=Hyla sarda TaxID=327740 RepID=UPI0024C348E3|nr:carbonic anhydrase 4-like [Hyla sarda]